MIKLPNEDAKASSRLRLLYVSQSLGHLYSTNPSSYFQSYAREVGDHSKMSGNTLGSSLVPSRFELRLMELVLTFHSLLFVIKTAGFESRDLGKHGDQHCLLYNVFFVIDYFLTA
jgi:hypothetical protein